MEEKLQLAYAKLDELLEVHKDHPMTTNIQFIKNSRSLQQPNNTDDAMRKAPLPSIQKLSSDDSSRSLSTTEPKKKFDMDMVAAEQALDNMKAFYEVQSASYLFKLTLTYVTFFRLL